jgi:hypothetical protein
LRPPCAPFPGRAKPRGQFAFASVFHRCSRFVKPWPVGP